MVLQITQVTQADVNRAHRLISDSLKDVSQAETCILGALQYASQLGKDCLIHAQGLEPGRDAWNQVKEMFLDEIRALMLAVADVPMADSLRALVLTTMALGTMKKSLTDAGYMPKNEL